jgi:hypothetical protein
MPEREADAAASDAHEARCAAAPDFWTQRKKLKADRSKGVELEPILAEVSAAPSGPSSSSVIEAWAGRWVRYPFRPERQSRQRCPFFRNLIDLN